jgi:hypothetical protein
MLDEESGKGWKDFTIDKDILSIVDPADAVFDNQYVYIFEVTSMKQGRFLGRNMWYDPTNDKSKTSFWCTYWSDTEGNQWTYYAFYGGQHSKDPEEAATAKPYISQHNSRFYVILPKDVAYVPDKKWAKVNVQVGEHGRPLDKIVWDTDDARHAADDPDVVRLFKSWDIEWKEA